MDIEALEAQARAQIVAIDQMDEVGIGVGGMTRPNLDAFMKWQAASDGYDHADTVLALIERLRAAETARDDLVSTLAHVDEATDPITLALRVTARLQGDPNWESVEA